MTKAATTSEPKENKGAEVEEEYVEPTSPGSFADPNQSDDPDDAPTNGDSEDKPAPNTIARNQAILDLQNRANEQEPERVYPEPAKPIKNDKDAVTRVLEYIDSFGTPVPTDLAQIRAYLVEGRTK